MIKKEFTLKLKVNIVCSMVDLLQLGISLSRAVIISGRPQTICIGCKCHFCSG